MKQNKLIAVVIAAFMLMSVCMPTFVAASTNKDRESCKIPSVLDEYAGAFVQDEDLENALSMLTDVAAYIAQSYEKAYEYAYDYAHKNAFIADAESEIDEATAVLYALLADFSAEKYALAGEAVFEVIAVLEQIKTALSAVDTMIFAAEMVASDLADALAGLYEAFEPELIAAETLVLAQIDSAVAFIENEVAVAVENAINCVMQQACEYFAYQMSLAYGSVFEINATIEETIKEVQMHALAKMAEIYGIVLDVNATVEEAISTISNHIAKITAGDYIASDDSFYVAIDGAGYAALLADALGLSDDQFVNMGWNALDFEKLADADLITVNYNASTVASFAANQLYAYVKAYLDDFARADASAYFNEAFASILNAETLSAIDMLLNGALDSILASEIFAGKEIATLDWAGLVGEENLVYVEQARTAIIYALAEADVPEIVSIPVDVVAAWAETGMLPFEAAWLYEQLGENAIYTMELPAIDFALAIAESVLYEKIRYNENYTQTLLTINKINPDATVVLLGGYEMYHLDIEAIVLELMMPLNGIFQPDEISAIVEAVTAAYNVFKTHQFALPVVYATLFENFFFVDVFDVTTNFEDIVAAYLANGEVEALLYALLFSDDITAPNAESCVYIVEQILKSLRVTCIHVYDDACTDVDCHRCGAIRVVGHTYTNNYVYNNDATHLADGTKTITCDVCGEKGNETITKPGTKLVDDHTFADTWLSDENNHWKACECGEKKDVAAHVDADDNGICDVCGYEPIEKEPVDPPVVTPPAGGGNEGGNEGGSGADTGKDDDKGMSTGGKVAVIVSSSVVGLVGAFSLGWFGFAKKSWTDLLRLFRK